MGKIKEIERKAHGRRKRKPVIYIICEGSETEYELQEEHIEVISRESNPVTTVFELVEYLNSKR